MVLLANLYAEDLRDFTVGSNIDLVPERGYVNLKCKNNKEIFRLIRSYFDLTPISNQPPKAIPSFQPVANI